MRDPLGTLARICYGKSPAEVLATDGEIPVVGTGGVYAQASRALFDRGVVVARKGSLGTPHLMNRPFWPSDTTFAVLPNDGVDLDWLYFNLLAFDLTKLNEATGVPSISRDWLAKVRFVKPGLVEQQRIAAILTSLDTAIEATEALIEKHQQVRAGLLHDLFARGVALDGSIRELQVPSRTDRVAVDAVPAGWDVVPLQRCLTESASNGIYKPPHLIGSGALLVGQTAITEDRSVDPKLARRAVVSAAEVCRFGVTAGDVLVARVFATVEGVGRPALVPDLGEPAVFESNMMRLRVAASVIRPRLLFEWLRSDASRRHIEGRANASNQVSVNQSVLYPLPVPIPPMDEQDRMVERIEAADRARAGDLAVLEKLRMQKQGLMQELLTGKVRVPVPADALA
ncbi:MAG: restriction endonuclease subunit S [Methylibium sp.]